MSRLQFDMLRLHNIVAVHVGSVGEGRNNMIDWHTNLFWSSVVLIPDAWPCPDSLWISVPFHYVLLPGTTAFVVHDTMLCMGEAAANVCCIYRVQVNQ